MLSSSKLGLIFVVSNHIVIGVLEAPQSLSFADAEVPKNAIATNISEGKELMGQTVTMHTFPPEEDVHISVNLQRGSWLDNDWMEICTRYFTGFA